MTFKKKSQSLLTRHVIEEMEGAVYGAFYVEKTGWRNGRTHYAARALFENVHESN